ncbi:MAG TPA: prolyl oligopeptidase family serine peptidase [Bacteroidales bacterium]|nr:prolyl oligopeptidase family serine peptidase [Bacteroidales bacterium]HPJ60759.1 prolyl oligopeptidase family serine peptidase [Bacteroidales bacterium]HPR13551.1 prolyl oligopeptidase family serine peptidase [Bacteroidales bacterium]HRW86591.1 prolyl oligopeptidase family serine peptidase [Bacteroidales bacterium]
MIRVISATVLYLLLLINCRNQVQKAGSDKPVSTGIYTTEQLDELLKKPACLEGYYPNQTGPLTRVDEDGKESTDSTFTVRVMKIASEGFMIHGWLYRPLKEGKVPLIVLTNGGGDDSRPIKSLSDWIAPILAHCGYAAFVHDKRGTGLSEGDFASTTYNDYINDAGNCATFLAKHPGIDKDKVGVMGGSEGGRIAVVAACRYPAIKFVISQAGTVVNPVEDRLYAQLNGMKDGGRLTDSVLEEVKPLWTKSFLAWAGNDPLEHEKVNSEIQEWRKKYPRDLLPFTKQEMERIPDFRVVLPTWNSLSYDYLTELSRFNKKWLAIFGDADRVVPTDASVKNIVHYMSLSGNQDYNIAIIPEMGHVPVNVRTKRMVRIDNLVINWLNENIENSGK